MTSYAANEFSFTTKIIKMMVTFLIWIANFKDPHKDNQDLNKLIDSEGWNLLNISTLNETKYFWHPSKILILIIENQIH